MSSDSLTAEEAKAQNILAMGIELGSVYDALWQQIAWLHRKWSEYVVLFGTKESRVVLLNQVAPSFTRVIQDALWEDVILHIARLTDPPKTAGKANLSVQTLAELVGDQQTKRIVTQRISAALEASEFCRDWRNRHIAHRDLRLALERTAEPLKPASRLKVREALKALSEVLNTVSSHYLNSTTHFEFDATSGGAMSLLHILDIGMNAEKLRRERHANGLYGPNEYRPRNL